MNDKRQITAESLKRAFQSGNPVEAAGYGQESTHKGFLQYLINTNKPNVAAKIVRCLCRAADASALLPERPPNSITCDSEQSLGYRRKVDLIVHWDDLDIPIEIKTDSGVSGSDQFEVMSEAAKEENMPVCLALLLGTSQVRRVATHDFKIARPRSIVEAFKRKKVADTPLLSDWLRALAMESDRYAGAMQFTTEEMDESWHPCGYRSWKSLMYYRLAHARDLILKCGARDLDWDIYDGGYNTVMNLDTDDFRINVPGFKGLTAYIEFNDSDLVVKLERAESVDAEDVQSCLDRFREEVERHCGLRNLKEPLQPRYNRLGKTWLTVLKWPVDLDTPEGFIPCVRGVLQMLDKQSDFWDAFR